MKIVKKKNILEKHVASKKKSASKQIQKEKQASASKGPSSKSGPMKGTAKESRKQSAVGTAANEGISKERNLQSFIYKVMKKEIPEKGANKDAIVHMN